MMQQEQYVNPPTLQPYPMSLYIVKDSTNYITEKWTTNFWILKKQTLQLLYSQKVDTTTFVVWKSGHYKLCSIKKQTLQTFVVDGLHKHM